MRKKAAAALVQVIAFKSPGPKWHPVGEPTERPKAVLILAAEWRAKHLARIIPIKTASSKAS
ncbi:hypothetical protein ACFLEY_22110 [Bradyrhizobium sp. YCK136]|uniref:hypothetical protein n=1 Tax=Bradyrhizobium sp. YCK136 TaxID=3351346 RepID=UPI0037C90C5A|nr:hypothetical protein XF16B_45340 [Bradyrhizobium diazoefficiens]BCF70187.1 hypothetical protein XF19B_45400 [Bradyrhizobium diazoefficiens]